MPSKRATPARRPSDMQTVPHRSQKLLSSPLLIIPDRLLPSLALGSLPLLPLLLLTPPLPLLLPHRAIKLALLLGPPRRPHTQRPGNQPPGNRSRLLGPLVQPRRVAGAHAAVEARAPGAVGRVVWEVEGGRRGRGRWRRVWRELVVCGGDAAACRQRCRAGPGPGLGFRIRARRLEVPAVSDGLGLGLVQRLLRDGG